MQAPNRVDGHRGAGALQGLPDWLPEGVRLYLGHTAAGRSLRALARDRGCHASTVLRQVRRFENRRDDPLVDDALTRLDTALRSRAPALSPNTERSGMPDTTPHTAAVPRTAGGAVSTDAMLDVLAQLELPGAVLAVAGDMPRAVILREDGDGRTERLDTTDRAVAEMLALRGWIDCRHQGRVLSYTVSALGHAALRARGLATHARDDAPARRPRYGAGETPVSVLARRRDKAGAPFLGAELVTAADRLHEDYVMARLDTLAPMPADALVAALADRDLPGSNVAPPGTAAARRRVLGALQDLGPGLADMVLRCCCRLEGVEAAEQAMNWSARSGKIVLRIGLQRLKLHYDRLGADEMRMG